MKIKFTIFIFTAGILLSGCGGGSSGNETNTTPSTPEEAATALENQTQNIGELSSTVTLPPIPEKSIAKATVAGIDSDNDGTRDELENIAFQGLNTLEGVSAIAHDQVISIINMIQPQDPPVENSINEHDIYCSYKALPEDVKKELPLSLLYSMVLDTQERKNAFNSSLAASTGSLEAESCE
jgi:hypothetical protein